MTTLLQTLLLETLPEQTDPILHAYIDTVLPAMEREFGTTPALGGSFEGHYQTLLAQGHSYALETARRWSDRADQSLTVHVLNALLTAWNLLDYLSPSLQLSETEKYLLCLGITLHDYNKYSQGQGEEAPKAHEVSDILALCESLGEKLDFNAFWSDWKHYISEIGFLAQNTQFKAGTNVMSSNWSKFTIRDPRRLTLPLRHLLGFGDVAVHLQDPQDLVTDTGGDRLREHLNALGIRQKLVYHYLKNSVGIFTNGIHNSVVLFSQKLDWKPLLFFARGVIYLAPKESETPDREELKAFLWKDIKGILSSKMLNGEIGFKRDGKGLKIAPQTQEIFTPVELIRQLPDVIETRVANLKNPATPKRLQKLELSKEEREYLQSGSDIRADRLAEFIVFVQREFFEGHPEFIDWMLDTLELRDRLSSEQTQAQSGGVNYGWYYAAAMYIANRASLTPEEAIENLSEIANNLANWAEERQLLPEHYSPTQAIFEDYLDRYLEVQGWEAIAPDFNRELESYTTAKTKASKQPICSLSSGEFSSEDQMDSVVLFKPQQYSNKNPLGGRQIKRGISKIWALEMLLRQAKWEIPGGNLEDRQTVFLYIFPAYLYSPQTAVAIATLVNDIKRTNLWDVCKHWRNEGMEPESLQTLQWLQDNEVETGGYPGDRYPTGQFPFMAVKYTTTRGKTATDAWVEPAFLTVILPLLLGVKVVATRSPVPLYDSDREFRVSAILDGVAGFWTLLGLPDSLRSQEFHNTLQRLLIAYSVHLHGRSSPPDPVWRSLSATVREIVTDPLNLFALANRGLRREKRERPSHEEVLRYQKFAQLWIQGDSDMEAKMKLIERLVREYRQFYQVGVRESSHAILLPLSKTLETILTAPQQIDDEDLIYQAAGQLHKALDRQKIYNRPILKDTTVDHSLRQKQELEAIHRFTSTCVKQLFGKMYRGDRALLQENRNRIKSGAEFAYRWLALQETQQDTEQQQVTAN
jgi:CRISPR-associated protein Csc3